MSNRNYSELCDLWNRDFLNFEPKSSTLAGFIRILFQLDLYRNDI
jgi:hypothetical protein